LIATTSPSPLLAKARSPSTLTPPPKRAPLFSSSLEVLARHNSAPVSAASAWTTPSVSITNSLFSETTGEAASRSFFEGLAMSFDQIRVGLAPSARCPIDLAALPPGWRQPSFAAASGSSTSTPASPLSATTSLSETRIGTRSPSTGVFLPPPLKIPQPLTIASATRAAVTLTLLFI
jgi:hypothetical protein